MCEYPYTRSPIRLRLVPLLFEQIPAQTRGKRGPHRCATHRTSELDRKETYLSLRQIWSWGSEISFEFGKLQDGEKPEAIGSIAPFATFQLAHAP